MNFEFSVFVLCSFLNQINIFNNYYLNFLNFVNIKGKMKTVEWDPRTHALDDEDGTLSTFRARFEKLGRSERNSTRV